MAKEKGEKKENAKEKELQDKIAELTHDLQRVQA
ncbi:nucleotide exchange factor GrpE, partial [Candidatus Woesearchaeota archaeon]|nr:nucleotide exchange factor GrpE [Candidatus Woesearchaeota archaeon]